MNGIVSVDDHVVEPATLWSDRLPARYHDVGPRVVRKRLKTEPGLTKDLGIRFREDPEGRWGDIWLYEDVEVPLLRLSHCAGFPLEEMDDEPLTFEDMRPGCFDAAERMKDMDVNGVERSLCFPNMFVRFAGQRFLAAEDKKLALLCIQAYNDWMIEEWAGPSDGRLVPITIVPLWDADLAAAEVRRVAGRGSRQIAFTEQPTYLGLPSIFSGYWEPVIQACEETNTAINLHIGSGSRLLESSNDAPRAVVSTLTFGTAAVTLTDWLMSGHFVRHPNLTVSLAECQVGWIPYILERADVVWRDKPSRNQVSDVMPEPPTAYFERNMFVSFFNDHHGLKALDDMCVDNVCFETDYPHSDGTWPNTVAVAAALTEHLDDDARDKVLRTNGLRLLERA